MKAKKILVWVLSLLLLLLIFFMIRNAAFGGNLPFYVFLIVVAALILPAVAMAFLPRLARRSKIKKAALQKGYTVTTKGFALSLTKENRTLWLFVAPRVSAGKTVCFINRHQYCTFLLIRADNRGQSIFRNPRKNIKRPDTTAFADCINIPNENVTGEKVVVFARMTPLFHVIVHKEETPLQPGGDAFGSRVTDMEHLDNIL